MSQIKISTEMCPMFYSYQGAIQNHDIISKKEDRKSFGNN